METNARKGHGTLNLLVCLHNRIDFKPSLDSKFYPQSLCCSASLRSMGSWIKGAIHTCAGEDLHWTLLHNQTCSRQLNKSDGTLLPVPVEPLALRAAICACRERICDQLPLARSAGSNCDSETACICEWPSPFLPFKIAYQQEHGQMNGSTEPNAFIWGKYFVRSPTFQLHLHSPDMASVMLSVVSPLLIFHGNRG